MSLADRLAAAQRDRGTVAPPSDDRPLSARRITRTRTAEDPFAELKLTVHQSLL